MDAGAHPVSFAASAYDLRGASVFQQPLDSHLFEQDQ
jgi:hypothetical protein